MGRSQRLLPHEIGHNLGLRHTNTPDTTAKDPETDWPYTDGTIQEYGFNFTNFQVVPRSTFDVMTYQANAWISPFHYKKLFDANGWSSTLAPAGMATQTYLVTGGLVYQDGRVDFYPFWQYSSAVSPENLPEGNEYCLELRDAGQAVLASRCFDLEFYSYEADLETEVSSFVEVLPVQPGTAAVVLRQGSTVLGQVPVSAHAPSVRLTQPNGGQALSSEATVKWTASDQDGDPLTFDLYYSSDDGITWSPVAANLSGMESYKLDLSSFSGGSTCRLRVAVSDGYHSTGDASDASFSVDDKPPLVGVVYPSAGAVISTTITSLAGYGYDLEEGELAGSSLAWTSDRDGKLGSGELLEDIFLTPGEHQITMKASDGQGHTSQASIIVKVYPQIVPGKSLFLPLIRRR